MSWRWQDKWIVALFSWLINAVISIYVGEITGNAAEADWNFLEGGNFARIGKRRTV